MSEPTLGAGPAESAPPTPMLSGDGDQSNFVPVGDSANIPSADSFNPAWKPLLDKLPAEFHKMVQPDLQAWDQNYQKTFGELNEVQSRYEPYAELIEQGVNPESIAQALQIVALIDADPQAFYKQMGEFYKWDQGQVPNDEEDFSLGGDEVDITQHPKFQEMANNQQVMAQYLQQQIQQQEVAQQEQQLVQVEQALVQKHGDALDMGTVYKLAMANGGDLDAAAGEYMQMYSNIRQTPSPGSQVPKPFAPNGAVPSTQPDPAKMNSKDTVSLVRDILASSNQGN